MAAKHVANPWEHVLRPSDFSKHRKLTFRPPNFNSRYDNWSSKPPFASRSQPQLPFQPGAKSKCRLINWEIDILSDYPEKDYETPAVGSVSKS